MSKKKFMFHKKNEKVRNSKKSEDSGIDLSLPSIERNTLEKNNNFQFTIIYDTRKHNSILMEGFGF